MKKVVSLLSLLLIPFVISYSFCGTEKNAVTKKNSSSQSSLSIPEEIRKNVPQDMQHIVFLQLILGLVKSEYVNELSSTDMLEKTIDGLLSKLDPHSSFLNEKAFATLKNHTEGEFGGLGIEIMMDEGFIRIISPIDDTPAYKAGLKSGDFIIYIDNECINGITSEEALDKLRGAPKTKVKLKIKRADKPPFGVTVERAIIKIQSVKAEIFDKTGYIRISTFDRYTASEVKKFIQANKSKMDSLVIDVRNNPGGLLDECIAVSNMFLKKGDLIVSTKGRLEENSKEYRAGSQDITQGMPIVVVINSATASAPEILAGALRDNKRAIIVGTRSFGKGSVQKVIPISEKAAIKLTVAKHYTPSGECIQANGIEPDIEAEAAYVTKCEGFVLREESLTNALDSDKKEQNKKKTDEENKKALEALSKSGKKSEANSEEEDLELTYRKLPLKERVEKDYQLSKAFDIIRAARKLKKMDTIYNAKGR